MRLHETTIDHCPSVLELYRRVAAIPGGLARSLDEVSENYVSAFVNKTISRGVGFVAIEDDGKVIGEIHAYKSELFCFSHVFTELTIAIDPDSQGKGVGRMLFDRFLSKVTECFPEISRVELIARESNQKAIQFYESLGFTIEGRLSARIKNVDGTLESDIPMAWIRS